ncbi:MAG: diaminopimelate epimerase [Saprospiraceae bacterium]|nr:diaminopimelate epimerase [Saprospiraceae bacterium]
MIFYKYHGSGNDFIIIDNREGLFPKDDSLVRSMCTRHFGIGADGLILLENDEESDFYMRYYNSDGSESTMCGNGGRCVVLFARQICVTSKDETVFRAADGLHYAKLLLNGQVALKMNFSEEYELYGQAYILDTGSPHYVRFMHNIAQLDMRREGRMVRNSARFKKDGINVNFVEEESTGLKMRTYERGVEDETLSCGTGVTAAAISWYHKEHKQENELVSVHTSGGQLKVQLESNGAGQIEHVWLIGPAQEVFIGEIDV